MKKLLQCFLTRIFSSIDANYNNDEENPLYQIPDESEPYNITLLNAYLLSLMKQHLTHNRVRSYD